MSGKTTKWFPVTSAIFIFGKFGPRGVGLSIISLEGEDFREIWGELFPVSEPPLSGALVIHAIICVGLGGLYCVVAASVSQFWKVRGDDLRRPRRSVGALLLQ
jgi:hypothetical protein